MEDLFAHRWVHAFEEDTEDGEVYRPEDADLPLSRRPRERLELSRDGSARVWLPSPDDRPRAQAATWSEESGELVVEAKGGGAGGGKEYRIVSRSVDRLVARRGRG